MYVEKERIRRRKRRTNTESDKENENKRMRRRERERERERKKKNPHLRAAIASDIVDPRYTKERSDTRLVCGSSHLTLFGAVIRAFGDTVVCLQASLLSNEGLDNLSRGVPGRNLSRSSSIKRGQTCTLQTCTFVLCQIFGLNHHTRPFHAFFPPPSSLFRKILAPIKIKSALSPPPPQTQNTPPLKRGILWTLVFPAERAHFFQAPIKLAQPFPAPELQTKHFTDTRIFLIYRFLTQ